MQRFLPKSDLRFFSLWVWENEDPRLQRLLLDLKGRCLPEARQRLLWAFKEFLNVWPRPRTICCVVSRTPHDHGLAMAQGFAKLYGCSLIPLQLPSNAKYKTQLRRERYRARRVLRDSSQRVEGPVWFVDDVLTTGATALAVWESLGRPKDYQVVTMVYRAPHSRSF
jgi:predicted amidophosphoribosyltransferase